MERFGPILAVALFAACSPASPAGATGCTLCLSAQAEKDRAPLEVQIDSGLDFSRFAQVGGGGGEAAIDPQTGARSTRGNLVGLGGFAVQGHARITGEPNAYVRVDLPGTVMLYSSSGAQVELTDFRTDLPSAPMLNGNGTLEFNFGARMETRRGQGGNFHGRIPIHIEYS